MELLNLFVNLLVKATFKNRRRLRNGIQWGKRFNKKNARISARKANYCVGCTST